MRGVLALAVVALAATLSPSPGVSDQSAPSPRFATTKPYVASSKACANYGNPKGICWWEGWEFRAKNICLESNIPNAPLANVAKMYTLAGSINVAYRGALGSCARYGFKSTQTVRFTAYTASDRKNYDDACAYTQAESYGNLTGVYVRVNVIRPSATDCGTGVEWQDVFAHEFGHAVGLSHNQKYVSSIMRDGHTVSAQDAQEIRWIYANNPRK